MEKSQMKEKVSVIAAGLILLSVLLMIIVLPGIYTKTLEYKNNIGAGIGILLAIMFRLLLFFWYRSVIKKNRRDGKRRVTGYLLIAIFLFILGTIYSDGAFSYLNNYDILYVSRLMFASVFCDLIAAILTFVAIFINRKREEEKSVFAEIPAWALALIVFIVSVPLSFTTYIPGIELTGMILYCVAIVTACFFICRKYPQSVWYTLLISNAVGILAIIQMILLTVLKPDNVPGQFMSAGRWIFWICCLLLSISGAIVGAKIGRRKVI
ncbi:hypothetical protein [Plebeiibacterium marinum]|uniref:Uncharacterized protein n=1 Tax=Plebeiibacterium marinum TaxID=2992111 RepID=A0AAE3MJC0_9BACT|nr:hypothetical protein [Plebeiobacterium marinum]MCW3808127.1 hypothetical protein [Plebeiobacterium marinum]